MAAPTSPRSVGIAVPRLHEPPGMTCAPTKTAMATLRASAMPGSTERIVASSVLGVTGKRRLGAVRVGAQVGAVVGQVDQERLGVGHGAVLDMDQGGMLGTGHGADLVLAQHGHLLAGHVDVG